MQEFLFFCPSPNEIYEGYFTPLADNSVAFRAELTKDSETDAGALPSIPENVCLIIREKYTGVLAGNAGVMTPMAMFCPGNVEIGYQFNQSAWGKGLGTMCSRLLVHLAFEEMNSHKVSADLYGKNKGSARVLEKAGLVKEGSLKDYYKIPVLGDDSIFVYDDKDFYGITLAQYQTLPVTEKYHVVERLAEHNRSNDMVS